MRTVVGCTCPRMSRVCVHVPYSYALYPYTCVGVYPCRADPEYADPSWYATLRAVDAMLKCFNETLQMLQYSSLLIVQQQQVLKALVKTLETMASLAPADTAAQSSSDTDDIQICGYYMSSTRLLDNAKLIAPSFDRALATLLEPEDRLRVASAVGSMFATAASMTQKLVDDFDAAWVPAVDPEGLGAMPPANFQAVIERYKARLQLAKGDEWERFHDELYSEYARLTARDTTSQLFKSRKTRTGARLEPATLEEIWGPHREEFPCLYELCGGIATMYPGITQVERHFSRMAFIRNKWRNSISMLALDGCFHCQQYMQLVALSGMCEMQRRQRARAADGGSAGECSDEENDTSQDDGSDEDESDTNLRTSGNA
eukprot:GHVU01155488.1.p2 GENE.GHVU01155488.1~~GHVU01155488.1.p2  ORF type:complete len:373 (+),score=43.52 GHVU01155488.1:1544-2662(+)